MNTSTQTPSVSHSTNPTTHARWTIDPMHSAVGFSVRHVMVTNVRGEFQKYAGEVVYDPANPEAVRVSATIEVASINTREPQRDGHLRSPDFFDAEKHPTMTFVSKRAKKAGEGRLDVTGDLTLRGTTREVVLALHDITGEETDLSGNKRMGATATTKIKRSEFGMTWSKLLETGGIAVGDDISITIDVSLIKAK